MKYNFGVVKELKEGETRVALSPDVVNMLTSEGLSIAIEKDAGILSGFNNEDYKAVGAIVLDSADEVWNNSKTIVKVKEPQESEFKYFREDLTIFSYLHLAVNPKLTEALLKAKTIAIAAESIETEDKKLPVLAPMSAIAGRLAIQLGSNYLMTHNGGSGVLLSGIPGVQPGKVIIIGAGVVGFNAAQIAIGLGADVSIFDIDSKKLSKMDTIFGASIKTHYCNETKLIQEIPKADLLITGVLIHSEVAPKIITEKMVKSMKKGSVIIDVAIDQGGNVETVNKLTSYQNPIFEKYGVLHCAIPNLPSATPKTAAFAFSYVIYPYLKLIGEMGIIKALKENLELSKGVNTYNGKITNEAVAKSLNQESTQIELIVGFKIK